MNKKKIVINWFRQDLRIIDNPSLNFASKLKYPILNIFILDEENCDDKQLGSASKFFLHHSLLNLDNLLNKKLSIFKGCAFEVMKKLNKIYDVKKIVWNRCYEPWRIKRDIKIKSFFENEGVGVKTFNGSLLWEPWNILKNDQTPYKVFTPYYRRGCLNYKEPRLPLDSPKLELFIAESKKIEVNELKLLPSKRWDKKLKKIWDISNKGMENNVKEFFSSGISNYRDGRNFPEKKNVSRLSPFIHWGLISPNILWYKCNDLEKKNNDLNIDTFKSELGWREFSYYLLYHFPEMTKKNLQPKFDKFPWVHSNNNLNKWKKGLTGYPIVDAGMIELWNTGYMHNRVRMIVGSFLVKNLLIDWREGEKWFWDCLLDADLASNTASWQWVAGTGVDAAPYFRIFNPITQGKKFDENGRYTKKYLPVLKKLPNKYLFSPWDASPEILKESKIILGVNYPFPIVDIKKSRNIALESFSSIKEKK